jgi:hypothetical protein
MSRRTLVLTWLFASSVPLALAIVLIGCCALPFHGLVHRLVPLCQMAEAVLTAHQHDGAGHEHPAVPPQKQDQQDGPRLVWKHETRVTVVYASLSSSLRDMPGAIVQRSQTAPGALRCDDDVGTRLALLDTLRI